MNDFSIETVKAWIMDPAKIPIEADAMAQLAYLDEFSYERVRIAAAQALGFRVSFVDRIRKEIKKSA